MTNTKMLITAEELLRMPDVKYCELVAGELVEKVPPQDPHGGTAIEFIGPLYNFLRQNRIRVLTTVEVGYIVSHDPDTVISPDIGFVSRERIPPSGRPSGFWPFAPDLAVEIVSPSDRYSAVLRKVGEYLAAGVRAVWVVTPAPARLRYTPQTANP